MCPKVFISHASEDKERFVLEFAERLRAAGIDAWLDRWEMLPGDSLVDKIFEEGLRQASAVVVVLSNHSVGKPWVLEELNAAFVKRVNSGSKLIPIVLDDCTIPQALASTVWEPIRDLHAYDESFNRIVSAVTGATSKPPLGTLPGYVTSPIHEIGGLAQIDNLVLKASCELALANGYDLVDGPDLQRVKELDGMSEKELDDSLEMLDRANLVNASRHLGGGLPHFRITTYGFQQYGQAYIPEYSTKVQNVALAIVNHNLQDNESIAAKLNENQYFVDHSLAVLESQAYISLSRNIGGHSHIFNVSASLRRALG
jgi:hypothetical protein